MPVPSHSPKETTIWSMMNTGGRCFADSSFDGSSVGWSSAPRSTMPSPNTAPSSELASSGVTLFAAPVLRESVISHGLRTSSLRPEVLCEMVPNDRNVSESLPGASTRSCRATLPFESGLKRFRTTCFCSEPYFGRATATFTNCREVLGGPSASGGCSPADPSSSGQASSTRLTGILTWNVALTSTLLKCAGSNHSVTNSNISFKTCAPKHLGGL
mmetsp:Transcript_72355/g.204489  ORF Transcript_72355/g.204489 Transcript_72355/m.204489 type:complete len:215 (+) Transcript_72355:983-1627(+)